MAANTRQETIDLIKLRANSIRKLGATAMYLFGSAARDELGPDSDVDDFTEYENDGLVTFVEWHAIEALLSTALGRPVDVRARVSRHPRHEHDIEHSSIRVF